MADQFDLKQLTPIRQQASSLSGGGDNPEMETVYSSPWGEVIGKANGAYEFSNPENPQERISLNPNGQGGFDPKIWRPGQGNFWTDIKDNVFGDKKLMAFLAVASAGAAASSAYGAGTAGATGTAGASTGASGAATTGGGMFGLSPTAGGVTGLTTTGSGVGLTATGASGAALPAATSIGTTGLGTAGAAGLGSAALSGAGSGGSAATEASTMQQISDAASSAGQSISEYMQNNPNAMKLLQGLLTNYTGNQQQDALNQNAAKYSDTILAAGQQAADLSKFTPYNITGGLTGATFDPATNTATQVLDPRLRAIQDSALGTAGGMFSSVNAGTPEQLAQQSYEKYLQWAKPAQDTQFSGLQDRLAGQGLLGLKSNQGSVMGGGVDMGTSGTVGPGMMGTSGGTGAPVSNTVAINPFYRDFAEGVATADLKNYENSILFGQNATNNQLNLGKGFLGTATGIDTSAQDAIKLGQSLGDSQSRSGAIAGNFLNNAANNAANVGLNRGNSEAGADAGRDNAIWQSIFDLFKK